MFNQEKLKFDSLLNGYSLFHYMAMLGPSIATLKQMKLQKVVLTNFEFDQDRKLPLYYAVERGLITICDFLIKRGADINSCMEGGLYPPFWLAAKEGDVELIDYFYYKGVKDVDAPKVGIGYTPLCAAASSGHLEAVTKLLDLGANPNDDTDKTPLYCAIKNNRNDVVHLLCKRGAIQSINSLIHGRTALHRAVKNGLLGAVTTLLEFGANPNIPDSSGCTVLYEAAHRNYAKIIEKLLVAGADINALSYGVQTALWIASHQGFFEVVQVLINHKVRVNTIFNDFTPLYTACREGHVKVVELLLSAGASAYLYVNNISPLIIACRKGHLNIVEKLLPAANINYHTLAIEPAIHAAVLNGNSDIVQILLKHGADPTIIHSHYTEDALRMCFGTALHLAVYLKNIDIIKLLVQACPSLLNLADNVGRTPLQLAEVLFDNKSNEETKTLHHQIKQYLKEEAFKLEKIEADIHLAASSGLLLFQPAQEQNNENSESLSYLR